MNPRHAFYLTSVITGIFVAAIAFFVWLPILWFLIILIPPFVMGMCDSFQKKDNILRNYPVWGHWRYLLLKIRPQIQQYFIETEEDGRPFSTEQRNIVKMRSENKVGMTPFGTLLDVQAEGYEWVNHSMSPSKPGPESIRIQIGGDACKKPYEASIYNCSAMSYGAISPEAIRAINRAAKTNHFYHNTGEGGLSKHHLREGGDIVWQIGTGYFGCRAQDGGFDPKQFKENAAHEQVKMIEIKISQGAKPSHGAILPAAKVTQEIADARGVPVGRDVDSPAAHSAFSTPLELCQFIQQLRDLSDGKPIGFKFCVGNRTEFLSICKAILKTGIAPDFITIDGSEGGTGAAPFEFTNHIGVPLTEGLIFVHSALCGTGLRKKIRLIASGKVITGFDLVTKLSLGADICNSARGMLFALGCVQSRRCHTNHCPTGITTQDPKLRLALNVDYRAKLVSNFHTATVNSFRDVLGATGLQHASDLHPGVIHRMVSQTEAKSYDEIYDFLDQDALLNKTAPETWLRFWEVADEKTFHLKPMKPLFASTETERSAH
jgi:glutamate synthase domain-containing protein 2